MSSSSVPKKDILPITSSFAPDALSLLNLISAEFASALVSVNSRSGFAEVELAITILGVVTVTDACASMVTIPASISKIEPASALASINIACPAVWAE